MSVTPLIDPAMARSGNAEAEMRSRQREIEMNRRSLNTGTQKSKEEKLRESCEGFEAMFIQKIWEGMRASLPQDGLMQSRDEKHWQGMYDQELGKSMAKAGGIGLADMMVSQLSRNLQSASDVAASSTARRKPMEIAPAPLLAEEKAPENAQTPGMANAQNKAGTITVASTQSLYSEAAPVAAAPVAPESTPETASETAAAKPVDDNTPPEVRAALSSLATLATQADVARGVGANAVEKITGQPGQSQQTQPTAAGQAQPTAAGQNGAVAGQNPQAASRTVPQAGTRNSHTMPTEDVHQFTRTQRQTARADLNRRPRNAAGAENTSASGAEFAQNTIPPSSTGKNVPTVPTDPRLGDAVTDLLKGQLGAPTVKTRI